MRYLGIDYGTKRIGLALSDDDGRLAFPRETIKLTKKLSEKIIKLCVEEKIETVIIGESKNYDGADNPIMDAVRKLADELKAAGLTVILEPEFMTTKQASQIQGEVEGIDASAAAIILQSYLDKENSKKQTPISKQIPLSKVQKEENIPQTETEKISYDQFTKVEIKVGKILTAEKIPDTDKLLKLNVDFGEEKTRQIVSGISLYFPDPFVLVGKNCLFVTNLEPRVIRGHESNGMILALSTPEGKFSLLEPNKEIPIGTKVK